MNKKAIDLTWYQKINQRGWLFVLIGPMLFMIEGLALLVGRSPSDPVGLLVLAIIAKVLQVYGIGDLAEARGKDRTLFCWLGGLLGLWALLGLTNASLIQEER